MSIFQNEDLNLGLSFEKFKAKNQGIKHQEVLFLLALEESEEDSERDARYAAKYDRDIDRENERDED